MRNRVLFAACALGVSLSSARAAEDAGAPDAVLSCDHVMAPGRVRCEVEARVAAGESIAWGDVVVVGTPSFAAALRGRIGPRDATARDTARWRWAFALVARENGTGDLTARVRLVVCSAGLCAARELPVVGHVVVGLVR